MKEQNNIAVCFSVDNQYFQHMTVAIASILKNKRPEDFYKFYIFETDLDAQNKNVLLALKTIANFDIEYIHPEFSTDILKLLPLNVEKIEYINITSYYRLLIPELVPEDKIIYLDCDIVVLDSLADLYNLVCQDNYLLGVRDISLKSQLARLSLDKYLNTGVLVFNVAKMREDQVITVLFDYIRQNYRAIVYHDQDILNAALNNKIACIDDKWNCQTTHNDRGLARRFNRMANPSILHFITKSKPWHPDCLSPRTEYYFDYLRLTPFSAYEKEYRQKRDAYIRGTTFGKRVKNSLKTWFSPVFSKKKSNYKTYNVIKLFGWTFKIKRRSKRKVAH